MADDSIIPGIYNYCDRWCERCPMTHRCQLGLDEALDHAMQETHEEWAERRTEQWQHLRDQFDADEESITIDLQIGDTDAEELQEYEDEVERIRRIVEAHPCVRYSSWYSQLIDDTLENRKNIHIFKEAGFDLDALQLRELPVTEDDTQLRLWDALQVLRWFQFQIHIKLARAVRSATEDRIDGIFDDDDGHIPDAGGSAKVALIGIDRSLAAWTEIRQIISPNLEEPLFQILLKLDQLRRLTEKAFPNARAIKRPGFEC